MTGLASVQVNDWLVCDSRLLSDCMITGKASDVHTASNAVYVDVSCQGAQPVWAVN